MGPRAHGAPKPLVGASQNTLQGIPLAFWAPGPKGPLGGPWGALGAPFPPGYGPSGALGPPWALGPYSPFVGWGPIGPKGILVSADHGVCFLSVLYVLNQHTAKDADLALRDSPVRQNEEEPN